LKVGGQEEQDAAGRLLSPRWRVQERPALEFLERLPELLLRVHYDRAVPRDGLLQWLSRDQQEPDPFIPGLYRYFVTAVKEHQRAVGSVDGRRSVRPPDPFGRYRERTRGIAELPSSSKNVGGKIDTSR